MNKIQTFDCSGKDSGTHCGACPDPESIRAEKKRIRRGMIASRKAMPSASRISSDAAINRTLLETIRSAGKKSSALVAYVSDGTEPSLTPVMQYVLESNLTLCLPRFERDGSYSVVVVNSLDFPVTHWGIPEPSSDAPAASPQMLRQALWLVPGVAFDSCCNRLGRGGGVYDRLLVRGTGISIGIYYELQRCDALPCDSTDCPTDCVVTEAGLFGYHTTKLGLLK